MTNQDFDRFTESLGAYYGHKSFTPAMKMTMWRFMQPLSAGEADQVIASLTETCARTPTPAQVKQAAVPFIHRANDRARQAELAKVGADSCAHCAGSGILIALLKENPVYEYSFGCPSCESYSVRKLKHPAIWNTDAHGATYVVVPLKADAFAQVSGLRLGAYAKMADREDERRALRQLKATRSAMAKMAPVVIDIQPTAGADPW